MEDSVTENEKLQVLITSVDDEDEKEGAAAKEVIINGVEEKPAVGFINQLITNFTPGGEGKEQEMREKQGKEETRNNDGGDHLVEEKEKPVGLINQIISRFAPGEKEKDGEEIDNKVSEEDVEEKKGGGGGVFSHILSNLVSSPVSSPRARDEKQAGKAGDELLENSETPEKDGNGVIDNIVSKLPAPLPDDAAPATDEASILIHSIIHD